MNHNLRGLFERALDDEPMPPGDLARAAIADGTRLRRRRRLLGGVATAVSLTIAAGAASYLAAPPPTVAPGVVAAAPSTECSAPVDRWAASVSIVLRTDATDAQRQALDAALRSDGRVRSFRHESREKAFEKFELLWRDDPRTTASVTPGSLPESFRVQMARPDEYRAFRAAVGRLDGVEEIIGSTCR